MFLNSRHCKFLIRKQKITMGYLIEVRMLAMFTFIFERNTCYLGSRGKTETGETKKKNQKNSTTKITVVKEQNSIDYI